MLDDFGENPTPPADAYVHEAVFDWELDHVSSSWKGTVYQFLGVIGHLYIAEGLVVPDVAVRKLRSSQQGSVPS